MRISLELVPRSWESLHEEMALARKLAASAGTVNIPDLTRFPIRSFEAAHAAQKIFPAAVPHIRAIDFDLTKPLDELVLTLRKGSIKEVLAVQGDLSPDRIAYPTKTTEFIARLKQEAPDLKIYAAVDPYRWEIKREMDYIKEKQEAGAVGFFSQPFFDLRLIDIYAEKFQNLTIFWGVSPVVTEKSRAYWESRNRAHFPSAFIPTLDWNVNFAREAAAFCHDAGHNLYLMPIKVDLKEYLKRVFACGEEA